MAVCADGSVRIACCKSLLVNTIQHFLILFVVTFLAGGIHLQRKIAGTAGSHFGMRKTGDIRMAVHTGDVFRSMHRGTKLCAVDGQ